MAAAAPETRPKWSSCPIVREIAVDPFLQYCGFALSICTLSTYYFEDWKKILLTPQAFCWPYLSHLCHDWRPFILEHPAWVEMGHKAFFILGTVSLVSFLHLFLGNFLPILKDFRRGVSWIALGSLFLAWCIREPFATLDFRFRHNAIYMLQVLAIFLILFLPDLPSFRFFWLFSSSSQNIRRKQS
jgi:hypothetical protein